MYGTYSSYGLRRRPTYDDIAHGQGGIQINPPNRFYTELRNSLEMKNLLDNEAYGFNEMTKYQLMKAKEEQAQQLVKSSQNLPRVPQRPESFEIADEDDKLAEEQAAIVEYIEDREDQAASKRAKFDAEQKEELEGYMGVLEAHMTAAEAQRLAVDKHLRDVVEKARQEGQVNYVKQILEERLARDRAEGQAASSSAAAGTVDPSLDEAMHKPVSSSDESDAEQKRIMKIIEKIKEPKDLEKLSEANLELVLKYKGHVHTTYQPAQRMTRGGIQKLYPYKRDTMIDILFPMFDFDMSKRSTSRPKSTARASSSKRAVN